MAGSKPKPKSKSKPKPKPKPKPEPIQPQEQFQPQEQNQPALSYIQYHLNLQNVTFPANDCNYTLDYSHANHHTMISTPGNTCNDVTDHTYNNNVVPQHMSEVTYDRMPEFTYNDVNNYTYSNNVVDHHMSEFTNDDHYLMSEFTYNDVYDNVTDNNIVVHHHMPELTYNDHHCMPEFTYDDVYYNDTDSNNTGPDEVKLIADIPQEDKIYLESFPPGYRFSAYDFELIVFYLKRKVENEPLPPHMIRSVNLYLYHPQKLVDSVSDKQKPENVWYFFTPRDRKYPNGTRPNRAAGVAGYWKATGADKSIEHEGGAEKSVVGYRKALVFYAGNAPNGVKTNWIMHEYRLNQPPRNKTDAKDMKLDDWVLCKLHKKVDKSTKISKDGGPSWGDGELNLIYQNGTCLSDLGVEMLET